MPDRGQIYIIALAIISLYLYIFFTSLYHAQTVIRVSRPEFLELFINKTFYKIYLDWYNSNFHYDCAEATIYILNDTPKSYDISLNLTDYYCDSIGIFTESPGNSIYFLEIYNKFPYDLSKNEKVDLDLYCSTKCFIFIKNYTKNLILQGNMFAIYGEVHFFNNATLIKFNNELNLRYFDNNKSICISSYCFNASKYWNLIYLSYDGSEFYVNVNMEDVNFTYPAPTSFSLFNNYTFLVNKLIVLENVSYFNFSFELPVSFNCSQYNNYIIVNATILFNNKMKRVKICNESYNKSYYPHPVPDYVYIVNYNREVYERRYNYTVSNGKFYFNVTSSLYHLEVIKDFTIS